MKKLLCQGNLVLSAVGLARILFLTDDFYDRPWGIDRDSAFTMICYCVYYAILLAVSIGCVRSWPYYTNKPLNWGMALSLASPVFHLLVALVLFLINGSVNLQSIYTFWMIILPSLMAGVYFGAAKIEK